MNFEWNAEKGPRATTCHNGEAPTARLWAHRRGPDRPPAAAPTGAPRDLAAPRGATILDTAAPARYGPLVASRTATDTPRRPDGPARATRPALPDPAAPSRTGPGLPSGASWPLVPAAAATATRRWPAPGPSSWARGP